MSSHVLSRLVISCHMSCHLTSCHVLSYHVISSHVMSCHVMSCHVMSCHVMSRLVMSCHVTSCHVMSSHVMSRLVRSCHLTSSYVVMYLMSCHLTSSYVVMYLAPEAFFRAFQILLLGRRGGNEEVFETVALCGNPARSDALAVAPRALRACRVAGVGNGATWPRFA